MDGWGVLAEAYAVKGQFAKADSALKELERLATSDVRKNNVRYARSRVARAKGDFRTAYDNEEAFRLGSKRLSITGKRESITAVQREYYKGLHDAEITRARTRKWKIGGLIALFILIIGMIYLIEVLSVMLQVGYFKLTHGKRIFRMAPIHHHFELGGWSETKVVTIFGLVTLILAFIAWIAL